MKIKKISYSKSWIKIRVKLLPLFLFMFLSILFEGCYKTEPQLTESEKTAELLKGVIADKKITTIVVLCETCSLSNTSSFPGWGNVFYFQGGFIYIQGFNNLTYNLSKLLLYETDNNGRLGLRFGP